MSPWSKDEHTRDYVRALGVEELNDRLVTDKQDTNNSVTYPQSQILATQLMASSLLIIGSILPIIKYASSMQHSKVKERWNHLVLICIFLG